MFFFVTYRRPALSTLFPYTTLFRSLDRLEAACRNQLVHVQVGGRAHIGSIHEDQREAFPSHAPPRHAAPGRDRKSTRLNSSHLGISYAVFCLKKKRSAKTDYLKACE